MPELTGKPSVVPAASILAADGDESPMTAAELRLLEIANLQRALRLTRGKIYGAGGAAELMGLKPTTLSSRIRALGLRPSRTFERS